MMLWLLLLQVWASCLWLGQGEVVESFGSCPQFFYQNFTPGNALTPPNAANICQTLNNQQFFATLYNKDKRIPVYSAYIYKRERGKRPTLQWMVEPQLIRLNLSKNMQTVGTLKNNTNVTKEEIMASQAVNGDYDGSGWDRGHLNPSGQHENETIRNATFTLTNAVPMNPTLNRGQWRIYEQQTMYNKAENCSTTHVIVGAVPGNSSINQDRVNIPNYIWAAACCETNNNNMSAWGAFADNNQNQLRNMTLGQLEIELANLYGVQNVSLFHGGCPRT
ncbi:endonuclease domain-containing 1 protein-like [Empidonax traillii]|uniref:endonuclease domain-containing 1 protein-like n=1 Tax=Empidonax traillii TaxID=164674 RepID=UPI000FFCE06D|nr:endonuclease domain-containing 1 protein-like [Empidonax traillii]